MCLNPSLPHSADSPVPLKFRYRPSRQAGSKGQLGCCSGGRWCVWCLTGSFSRRHTQAGRGVQPSLRP